MINIWFCHHRRHRLLDIALAELEESMLVPDSFEIKIWSPEMLFKEAEAAGVCYAGGTGLVVFMAWEDEVGGFYALVCMIRSCGNRF